MAIAITTKFFGPTDTKGARVKATDENTGRTLTLPWEHAWSHDENHEYAANKLADSQYSVPRILGRSWMRNQSRVHLYEPTPQPTSVDQREIDSCALKPIVCPR